MTPEQTEKFNKGVRRGPGYNRDSLDKRVNLSHPPVELDENDELWSKSAMAQKKLNLKKFLYDHEIELVTQCPTWDLLGRMTGGGPKVHAQAIMEIWAEILREADRATQGLELAFRLGTVRTRMSNGGHCSFLYVDKGKNVYLAGAPMSCRMGPPGGFKEDGDWYMDENSKPFKGTLIDFALQLHFYVTGGGSGHWRWIALFTRFGLLCHFYHCACMGTHLVQDLWRQVCTAHANKFPKQYWK